MSRISALLVLLLGVFAGAARADVFNLGEYGFFPGDGPGQYELIVSLPETVATDAAVTWPAGCTQVDRSRQSQAGRARLAFTVRCDRDLARGDVVVTPWRVDGVAFTSGAMGGQAATQLPGGHTGVVLPVGLSEAATRPLAAVAADFLRQGFLHILGGWDHLAFVLCLCLLTRGRTLLLLVTVFTVGHSLSLALAFFDVVRVAVPPVEAVIALSIAFMAREALLATRPGGEDTATRTRYMAVVGSFGLLHGLGFATAIGELGVPAAERVAGLIFFNLGVEAGQIAFVTGVLGLAALARAAGHAPAFRAAALYGAGSIGAFWLIERVAGFGDAIA